MFKETILLCALHLSTQYISAENLKVSVYYETLCPDSINFVKDQLYPVYQNVGSPLNVDLVPYGFGKSEKVDGKWNFTCQHGPKECHGNKVHACAIANYPAEQSLKFVYLSLSSKNPTSDDVLKNSSSKAGINWNVLQTCYNDGTGDDLLVKNGNRTAVVSPVFIPTIIFNNSFNQALQDLSLTNFSEVVQQFIDVNNSSSSFGSLWILIMGLIHIMLSLN